MMKPRYELFERRPSDIVGDILRRLEKVDGCIYIDDAPISQIKREMREAFKLVRQLENEVSQQRWNEKATHEATIASILKELKNPNTNVVVFPVISRPIG